MHLPIRPMFLFLGLASPGFTCPLPSEGPGEDVAMLALAFFLPAVCATLLHGLGRQLFAGHRGRGRTIVAIAILAFGLVLVSSVPLLLVEGTQKSPEAMALRQMAWFWLAWAGLRSLFWARRHCRRSLERGGRLLAFAGSPLWGLALLGSPIMALMAAWAQVWPGWAGGALVTVLLSPILAVAAIPLDRLRKPAGSGLPGRCPVCRDPVHAHRIDCVQCGTPHHTDCLSFNGRCGIYGCQPAESEPLPKGKADAGVTG